MRPCSQTHLTRRDVLVAEDFTCIFLTADRRRRLDAMGVSLAVRRPARLLAVTVNPTAPGRPPPAGRVLADPRDL